MGKNVKIRKEECVRGQRQRRSIAACVMAVTSTVRVEHVHINGCARLQKNGDER
jgi:hypothetical protein